jgi:hypothetical protein
MSGRRYAGAVVLWLRVWEKDPVHGWVQTLGPSSEASDCFYVDVGPGGLCLYRRKVCVQVECQPRFMTPRLDEAAERQRAGWLAWQSCDGERLRRDEAAGQESRVLCVLFVCVVCLQNALSDFRTALASDLAWLESGAGIALMHVVSGV